MDRCRWVAAVAMAVCMAGGAVAAPPGLFPLNSAEQPRTVRVPLNKSIVINLDRSAAKVSIGNSNVADILIMGSRQVYVVGKSLGATNVVLWNSGNRVAEMLNVEVTHDLESLKEKLHRLLPGESIQVNSSRGNLVLSGEVSSTPRMDAAMSLAESFLQKSGKDDTAHVINLMQVGGAKQVMLEVQVAEVSRELTKRLGIKFNAINAGGNVQIGAVNGGATFPDATLDVPQFNPNTGEFLGFKERRIPVFSQRTPIGPYMDEFAPSDMSIDDMGIFASRLAGNFFFHVVLEAAKQTNLAKVLAEPTLTTMTGQEASFLSGGEFPIPVPGNANTGTTIEFKEFGIGLRFLPVVLDSGTISMKVNVSVSELTNQNTAILGVQQTQTAFFIPALSKRSAYATVELAPGQTIGIAGLIDENLREVVNKFPGLGDIPILGLLFRSQEFVKGRTELVIFVTPHLARPVDKATVRLPTDAFVEPGDLDFYLMGRMQGKHAKVEAPSGGGMEGDFGHDL